MLTIGADGAFSHAAQRWTCSDLPSPHRCVLLIDVVDFRRYMRSESMFACDEIIVLSQFGRSGFIAVRG
jgi:hypothetical protein